MNGDEIIAAQRDLRSRLLGKADELILPSQRDLAAHLLLYLDDSDRCWQIALDWLRVKLDADRADGAYVNHGQPQYRLLAESIRHDMACPPTKGIVIDAGTPAICTIWRSNTPVVFNNLEADLQCTPDLRTQWLELHTKAKVSIAIRDQQQLVGIICCDLVERSAPWSAEQCFQLDTVSSRILGPVLKYAYRFSVEDAEAGSYSISSSLCLTQQVTTTPLSLLTPAELNVARLVAKGLSYKEVARQMNRSFSTVDYRLRSIRHKLGVTSTARLISVLSDYL